MRVHIEWPTLTIHIYPMLTGLPPRVHARALYHIQHVMLSLKSDPIIIITYTKADNYRLLMSR